MFQWGLNQEIAQLKIRLQEERSRANQKEQQSKASLKESIQMEIVRAKEHQEQTRKELEQEKLQKMKMMASLQQEVALKMEVEARLLQEQKINADLQLKLEEEQQRAGHLASKYAELEQDNRKLVTALEQQRQEQEVARKQEVQGFEKELEDRIELSKAGQEIGKVRPDLEEVKCQVQKQELDCREGHEEEEEWMEKDAEVEVIEKVDLQPKEDAEAGDEEVSICVEEAELKKTTKKTVFIKDDSDQEQLSEGEEQELELSSSEGEEEEDMLAREALKSYAGGYAGPKEDKEDYK